MINPDTGECEGFACPMVVSWGDGPCATYPPPEECPEPGDFDPYSGKCEPTMTTIDLSKSD